MHTLLVHPINAHPSRPLYQHILSIIWSIQSCSLSSHYQPHHINNEQGIDDSDKSSSVISPQPTLSLPHLLLFLFHPYIPSIPIKQSGNDDSDESSSVISGTNGGPDRGGNIRDRLTPSYLTCDGSDLCSDDTDQRRSSHHTGYANNAMYSTSITSSSSSSSINNRYHNNHYITTTRYPSPQQHIIYLTLMYIFKHAYINTCIL